jgi:hypothetical protein
MQYLHPIAHEQFHLEKVHFEHCQLLVQYLLQWDLDYDNECMLKYTTMIKTMIGMVSKNRLIIKVGSHTISPLL